MDKPSDEDIQDQLDLAHEQTDLGQTAVPGMTYEEGVAAALLWVNGDADVAPIEVPINIQPE